MLSSQRRRGRAGTVTPYSRVGHLSTRMGSAVETLKRLNAAAAQLTAGMKSRGIYPKSSLQRKLGGTTVRTGRRIPVAKSNALSYVSGGYAQYTQDSVKSGRKKRTTFKRLVKEVRGNNETAIYRFGAINPMTSTGWYWIPKINDTVGLVMQAPVILFDLSSVINTVPGGTVDSGAPMKQLTFDNATGRAKWNTLSGVANDGASVTQGWHLEKASSANSILYAPHEKSRLLWTDLKMVLHGAKGQAVKFTVQIIKLKRDSLDPWIYSFGTTPTGTREDQEHQALWQSLAKPYLYNPIATTGTGTSKFYKVLKSYSAIIQPTSLDENDPDPHSKVLKWFMRWDRDINYKQAESFLSTAADVANQADYTQTNARTSPYTTTRSKLFLLIRATAYTQQNDTPTNAVQPSFDLNIRNCHVPQ